MKFKTPSEAIEYLKKIAENPDSPDYKIANEMIAKSMRTLLKDSSEWEFKGNVSPTKLVNGHVVKVERTKSAHLPYNGKFEKVEGK